MTQDLTQIEIIQLIGIDGYQSLMEKVLKLLMESEEYKRNDPFCSIVTSFPIKTNDNWNYLVVIATSKLLPNNQRDFGIIRITLSESEAPDFLLDIVNKTGSTIKTKEEVNNMVKKAMNNKDDYLLLKI